MDVDRMQEREVFVAKGQNKMKKVHFSIKLIEIVFIIISGSIKGIAVFFITKEDREMKESKKTRWEAE